VKEVKGACGTLQNEEFHYLYRSPNIIQVTTPRRMKRVGHVARMGRGTKHTGFRRENRKEKDQLEDLRVHGRILKLI
jgi:hypothetical protein